MMEQTIARLLQQKTDNALLRQVTCLNDYVSNFSSNDYLGLSQDWRNKAAFQHAYAHYPTGSGGSMTVSGYHQAHQQLEHAFCEKLNTEAALLFSSGYAANLALISFLVSTQNHVLIDRSCHASFYDGIRLAQAPYTRFFHQNLLHLQQKLANIPTQKAIITEGIFSMSGQQTDIKQMNAIAKQYHSFCILDEAHSFGVIGKNGMGIANEDNPLRVIPFGKAMASQGALITGKREWINCLLQFARSNIYSTAISPAHAKGLISSLQLVYDCEEKRSCLQGLITYFRQKIDQSPHNWRDSHTPIQQLQLACPRKALHYATTLLDRGIVCLPMRQPTVSHKETGLRIVLNAQHDANEIDMLFKIIDSLYEN